MSFVATTVCGVTIGSYAFVGAGAVITRNVPDHALVVGNPARQIGWACQCGERLTDDLDCPACQGVFDGLGHQPGDFPAAENVAARCLNLPMSPYLSEVDQETVVGFVRDDGR